MKPVNVGIVGAAGYSGEELVRLIAGHPHTNLTAVTSRSLAGQPVVDVMPRFRGLLPADFTFTTSDSQALAERSDIDVFFLALPHGVAAEYAEALVAAGKKVLDLSADFRLSSTETYSEYYGQPHPAPDLLSQAAYVIPEITAADWQNAKMIACPGCYPTSVITPLAPLLKAGLVDSNGIIVNAMSGVSGAGKKLAEDYLYCERNESAKAYGVPKHRHLSEIEEQLSNAASKPVIIQFTPHLVPMKRGIATTIVAKAKQTGVDAIYSAWQDAYGQRPFVGILPSGKTPDTAHVTGTNRIDFSAAYDQRTGNVIITSAEDNLLKGASGQAVQIMNLWLGFPETTGLL
ncbi:N-acetyl-gamma-glutamyl-phosphate reductase [Cerasicoccus arenae]|uniref:N-acetyl-gamma-glutamyl-phosphate reductase n=1 Tax=Cerasicoccus arenae TaxID=424488 RepID=A0A8J3DGH0_9BACT|nr:N-acetyl-gamma-glutamyl-phosphate reductase [Cerasicoccus arenae]MBK1856960.1 N-acetyl-gamma-glutamyl-phosphate reductase [Cerasicoccus arenae]GHB90065.1 N-acetyl-gamma-glutamyl-phosphate reductase [Cerasicoccus arenae]